ncbi:unnamed protein product [Discosporangium mesarthrocarpum]
MFESVEGKEAALGDTLRIFGVQVRGHMSRTHPPDKCRNLYVENPESYAGLGLQWRINAALSPSFKVE